MMRASTASHTPPSGRFGFRLLGLATLLVVLLCAALATGQPRTRVVGSAFDPSTTSVALSPKKLRIGQAARAAPFPGEPLGFAAPAVAAVAAPILPVAASQRGDAGPLAGDSIASSALPRISSRPVGSRAPPLA
jgi:hypothetical protein